MEEESVIVAAAGEGFEVFAGLKRGYREVISIWRLWKG
jgi:hypothetical protein